MSPNASPCARPGRYQIETKLGGPGDVGEVHLPHDTKLDRKVALKVLPTTVASSQNRRCVEKVK